MKTKEELNQLKTEYEALNTKLQELTEDELKQVTGGAALEQDNTTPKQQEPDIPGLEFIGPYAVGGIPLDSDSKLKS